CTRITTVGVDWYFDVW
nr:immunoglobulin heavy chain junction region [Mus musculus]MBK4195225.1 immunoglobulin heavy chain junction region [Mus musculus]MBK4195226.1 immunoglobulin heavy chain junction region [Mus musculus]